MPTNACADQPGQRILEAATRVGGDAGVTGWASLHLAGARWFEGATADGGALPVQIRIGPARRLSPRPGVLLDRCHTFPDEIVVRHGVRCLNIHRSLFDEVLRRGDVRDGAAAIDMVLFAELTTSERFEAWLASVPRTPGLPLVRQAFALSMAGAESPPETAMRLAWLLDAELPTPICNVPVHDRSGRFLGRPDLICPEVGVAAEYEGAHHFGARARSHDLTREGGLRNHGLEVVSVVGGELARRELVAQRFRDAVGRAANAQVEQRWELHGPNGPAPDLAERFRIRLGLLSSARRTRVLADAPTVVARHDGA